MCLSVCVASILNPVDRTRSEVWETWPWAMTAVVPTRNQWVVGARDWCIFLAEHNFKPDGHVLFGSVRICVCVHLLCFLIFQSKYNASTINCFFLFFSAYMCIIAFWLQSMQLIIAVNDQRVQHAECFLTVVACKQVESDDHVHVWERLRGHAEDQRNRAQDQVLHRASAGPQQGVSVIVCGVLLLPVVGKGNAVFCCFLWWAKGNSRIHSVSLAYSVFCAFQCASVPLGMNAHIHTYASGLLEHISAYMHICRCMYLPGFWSACAPVPHMQACMYAHTCTWTRAHTHPHTHTRHTHSHAHACIYIQERVLWTHCVNVELL